MQLDLEPQVLVLEFDDFTIFRGTWSILVTNNVHQKDFISNKNEN